MCATKKLNRGACIADPNVQPLYLLIYRTFDISIPSARARSVRFGVMPCPMPQNVSLSASHFATQLTGWIGTAVAPPKEYVNSRTTSDSANPLSRSPCFDTHVA